MYTHTHTVVTNHINSNADISEPNMNTTTKATIATHIYNRVTGDPTGPANTRDVAVDVYICTTKANTIDGSHIETANERIV